MQIVLLLSLSLVFTFFIGKRFLLSAKRNLFKDQAAWSSQDIKIKYKKNSNDNVLKENNNYLKLIADESKTFLEEQADKNTQ